MGFDIYTVFSIYALVEAIWLILPAYAANGLMPLARGKRPIDGGRTWGGKPILGKGKTWEGLLFGAFIGLLIGTVEMLAFPYLPWDVSPVALVIAPMGPLLGLLLGLGAGVGDLAGSFIKRRANIRRGGPAPLLDQEDFIFGSLIFASALVSVQLSWWLLLLILTPVLHVISCVIGYLVGVKKEPW